MRFMIMHRTNPHWEGGGKPGPQLVARVGALLGEMERAGVLLAGEGLRESALGARLRFSGGARTVIPGPFRGENELPAALAILRVASLDEAIEWASRIGRVLRDGELDVRPVTEPWHIGAAPRPEGLTTTRYMVLRKADAASEAGTAPAPQQSAALADLLEEMRRVGVLLGAETLRPSARGRRIRAAGGSSTVLDGPFAESKELIAGYVMVRAASLEEAAEWAPRYLAAVGCAEVDVREVAETP
jgi:hypothetical protein